MNKATPIKPIVLGKIGACYGIHGWLKIFSYTEKITSIFSYKPWFIQKTFGLQEVILENWRRHNHGLIFKLKEINNRNEANLLVNHKIIGDSLNFPKLNNKCYYWKDLIGCFALTTQGYNLGVVTYIIKTKSYDILVIKSNFQDKFGIKERLIPFVYKQIIKRVDLNTHKIEIQWDPSY